MKSPSLVKAATFVFTTALLIAVVKDAEADAPTMVSTATLAYATTGAVWLGPATGNEPVTVSVSLRLRNRPQLEAVAEGVESGTIPPLTHDELMSTYAPTQEQADAVAAYLTSQGYTDVTIDDNRFLVSADGTASMAASAFNTSLAHFTHNGSSGIANITDAQIPAALSSIVVAVLGLQAVEHATTAILHAPPVASQSGTAGVPGAHGYDPTAFPLVYAANTLPAASAVNVGIVSEGSLTNVLVDVRNFELQNGLALMTPSVIYVGGSSSDTSNDDEWDLDSQTILSMSGGVGSLTFYVAPSFSEANLAAAYSKIVSVDTAKIINVSLIFCESYEENNGSIATDDQIFLSAVAQGQIFSVASGDSGSRMCGAPANGQYGTTVSVSYPASSPYVVAVGGTTLSTNNDGTWASESAWSYSGGGVSAYEQPTQWTQGITSVPSGVRGVPDVAMDGDPNTGAIVLVDGVYEQAGGTSLSSPLFVGAWSRIEAAQGNAFGYPNPIIYSQRVPIAAFHDITSGNNDDYNAGPNWDYTTGWGTVIASTLSTNLKALPNAPASISDANGGYACPTDKISWSAVAGATSYELYAQESAPSMDRLFDPVWSGTATSTSVRLGQSQAFYYSAKACNGDGCSQLSTQVFVREGTCP